MLIRIFALRSMFREDNGRMIIEFEGSKKGPLIVVIAAIHGNEQAGIRALQLVGKMLDVEHITNPSFSFNGKFLGLIGNRSATSKKVRFIDQDLNRMWSPHNIQQIEKSDLNDLNTEERELSELLTSIYLQINEYNPPELYILDLHTTSSGGGIFSIPSEDPKSLMLARNLHAPVVLNMLEGIRGTTLHYFNKKNFTILPTTSVTFEAGQHDDAASINRCIAAIINCLRSVGCVRQEDVENIHDRILKKFSEKLPVFSELLYKHEIRNGDGFVMRPGFNNFDPVKKNDHLADDNSGPIYAKQDGLILMPLYQPQGEEGFYVIRPQVLESIAI